MASTIYKYACPSTPGTFTLSLPSGAQVLTGAMQGGFPMIWALIPDEDVLDNARHRFALYMTGASFTIPEHHRYLTTFLLNNGSFVLHLFHLTPTGA